VAKVVSNNSFLFIPSGPDFPSPRLETFDSLFGSSFILDTPGESLVDLQKCDGIKFHHPHENIITITFPLNNFVDKVNTDRGDLSRLPGLKTYRAMQAPCQFIEPCSDRNSGKTHYEGFELVQWR